MQTPNAEPWYSKLTPKALFVAVIVAVVTGVAGKAVTVVWDRIQGDPAGHLTVLETRVTNEPGVNPNYNATALSRIVTAHDFPRLEVVLRNTGKAPVTLRQLAVNIERVWILHDPWGPVIPPPGAPDVNTPEFGAYGPNDVRVTPEGAVVPPNLALTQDIAANASATLGVTLRNLEDPSTAEYVFLVRLTCTYDEDETVVTSQLVAMQAIGSFIPEYSRDPATYVPQTDRYDAGIAQANVSTAEAISRVDSPRSPRVDLVLAHLGAIP